MKHGHGISVGDKVQVILGLNHSATDIRNVHAGRDWIVDHVWDDGLHVSVHFGEGLQRICNTFRVGALVVTGKHVNHGCDYVPVELPDITRPSRWGYGEEFADLSKRAQTIFAVDGYSLTSAVIDEVSGKLTDIKHHTNEVQEDTAVQLYYTDEANGVDKYELAKEIEGMRDNLAVADERTEKKAAKWRGAAAERERIIREIKAAEKKLEQAQFRVPQEPRLHGRTTVITFKKTFGSSSRKYEYAAIRPEGLRSWSISGARHLNAKLSWAEVVEFIRSDEKSFTPEQKALDSIRVVQS